MSDWTSLKETHYCVMDGTGAVVFRGREATQPELPARALARHAPDARVVVLETGGQSSWLQAELEAHGTPAVIVDARRARLVLNSLLNKTDANDARGWRKFRPWPWSSNSPIKDQRTESGAHR